MMTQHEYTRRLVELYVAWGDRVPDKSGLDWHIAFAQANGGFSESVLYYTTSQNFYTSIAAIPGSGWTLGMTDPEFIAQAYNLVLGRPDATSADITWWVGRMKNDLGDSRGAAVADMVNQFFKNDPRDATGYTTAQKNAMQAYLTKFENKVQAGLIAYSIGYNPTGTPAAIATAAKAVIAGVTDNHSTVISAVNGIGYPTLTAANTLTVLVLGQSNGANFGRDLYDPTGLVTYFDTITGKERAYRDTVNYNTSTRNRGAAASERFIPPTGYTVPGGSIWGRMGDMLVSDPLSGIKKVFFDTRAIGSTTIHQLSKYSSAGHWADTEAALLARTFDAIVIMQGESDNNGGTSPAHATALQSLWGLYVQDLHALAPTTPIYVARESRVNTYGLNPDPDVIAAQNHVISTYSYVHAGPDVDAIASSKRDSLDTNHFNGAGLDDLATSWKDILV